MNKKALVIFGATGALAHNKIFPSLKHLLENKSSIVSNLEIVGYGRKALGGKH
jgi:glucose-6-phosphate 1-dehydrogenase